MMHAEHIQCVLWDIWDGEDQPKKPLKVLESKIPGPGFSSNSVIWSSACLKVQYPCSHNKGLSVHEDLGIPESTSLEQDERKWTPLVPRENAIGY